MKRVGILRGGTGKNYTQSLKKGGDIILHLSQDGEGVYKVADILVDKDHIWHFNGVPIVPSDLARKVDIVWNTSHPSYSNILESLSIPTIGTSAFTHSQQNSKDILREHMKKIGVPIPRSIILHVYQKDFDPRYAEGSGEASGPREKYAMKKAKEIHEKFGGPWIVKSLGEDKTMGIHLAKTFPQLIDAIEDGVNHGQSLVVEEFILGKVASVHTMPEFRGEDMYTFPFGNTFGNFSPEEKEKLSAMAKDIHQHIAAGHYLKSDMILTPRGKIYLLQIDTEPDFKPESHLSQVAELAGIKIQHIVEHILNKCLN